MEEERDDLYQKFVKAIHEVQQKSNFKNLLLEKKLAALADTLEKKEAQLNEVLSASNLDPTALTVVTRKLEVRGREEGRQAGRERRGVEGGGRGEGWREEGWSPV